MEKLKLEHLAPYLPYGLKGRVDKETYLQEEHERIGELKAIDLADHNYELAVYGELGYFLCDIHEFKPILRPLSSITDKIDNNPNNLTYCAFLKLWTEEDIYYCKSNPLGMPYETIQQLIEWHFDVFGLIDKGLAININTL